MAFTTKGVRGADDDDVGELDVDCDEACGSLERGNGDRESADDEDAERMV